VIIEDENTVICLLDSVEKAEEIISKIKSDVRVALKAFDVTTHKKYFIVYQECMDDQCYEKYILKVVENKSDYILEYDLTEYDIFFEEITLNDVTHLFEGKYQSLLKEPIQKNPFVDSDYIAYIKEMRQKYN